MHVVELHAGITILLYQHRKCLLPYNREVGLEGECRVLVGRVIGVGLRSRALLKWKVEHDIYVDFGNHKICRISLSEWLIEVGCEYVRS